MPRHTPSSPASAHACMHVYFLSAMLGQNACMHACMQVSGEVVGQLQAAIAAARRDDASDAASHSSSPSCAAGHLLHEDMGQPFSAPGLLGIADDKVGAHAWGMRRHAVCGVRAGRVCMQREGAAGMLCIDVQICAWEGGSETLW